MKLIKTIIAFILVFGIIFIVKLFMDKNEFKIVNDTYFSSNNIELALYSDGTYYMHEKNNIKVGTYKLHNNIVTFEGTKKYNDVCYNTDVTFKGTLKGSKNIESINIDDIIMDVVSNIDKLDYITDLEECENNKTYSTSKKDYGIEEKYSHDIVINDKQINYKTSVEDKESLNKFLHQFFERYYNIMETLEYKDISDMFVDKKNAYIYKTALELLILNRKRSENDLAISNVKYELTVKNYSKNDDIVSFTVLENCSYNFNFIKQYTSSVYNIKNEFKLVKTDNGYKIINYDKVQDFYVMIPNVEVTDYKSSLDKIKEDYLKSFEVQDEKRKKMKEDYLSGNYEIKKCDNEYNRKSSYEYATNWVGRRNTKWPSHVDSNCVNFVSQVMNAGGIPMDEIGNDNSKWFSKGLGNETYSWINVGGIRAYFKENQGFGLCGKYDENIYLGEIGDVILVGPQSDSKHAITVIGQIKDSNGKVIDLLVSSNTVDLIYFPLSAYAYPYKVLSKVYGYNN